MWIRREEGEGEKGKGEKGDTHFLSIISSICSLKNWPLLALFLHYQLFKIHVCGEK